MPSAIRLVPMVNRPITSTGASTAQGWVARPSRFSLIIWPQLAAPGSVVKPRKPRPATRMIEKVRRRPASASSGAFMLGSTSATITRLRFSPRASAAWTKSRETMPSATPRAMRAVRGALERPTSSDDHPGLGLADRRQHDQRQQDLGEGEHHVVEAHDHLVPPAAGVGRDHADQGAEHHAEHRAEHGDDQDLGAAVHQPGEHVLAEVVGAEDAPRWSTAGRRPRSRRRARRSGPKMAKSTTARVMRPPNTNRFCCSAFCQVEGVGRGGAGVGASAVVLMRRSPSVRGE